MPRWRSICGTSGSKTRSCWKPATRWRSTSRARARRAGHGGPRLHRFRLAGRSGGGYRDPRPPASFGGRLRAADHRDQQAHRQERRPAGNRQPRLRVGRRRRRQFCRSARQWLRRRSRHPLPRRRRRLGRDAGKNPRRSEALPQQADVSAVR